jgi:hypothetical protein
MARGSTTTLEVIGGKQLSDLLGGMAQRTDDLSEVFRAEIKFMERFEGEVFSGYGGKYVETGRLRDSLTTPGAGAVRRPSEKGLIFGTSIFYGRFQTSEIGPETPRGGMRRSGENMVVKMPPSSAERLPKAIGDHIMGHD